MLKTKTGSILQHIQQATLILMAGAVLEYALSFVKSLFIAAYYGTSEKFDAYVLALAPHRLISGVLLGATQAVLIPRYLELREKKGQEHALALFVTYGFWILAFILLVGILLFAASPLIALYLGVGFDESRLSLTSALLKIVSIFLILTIMNGMLLYLFQAHRQFIFLAFIPLMSGIISLAYIIYFRRQGIFSLMYGLVVGMGFQMCLVVYTARQFLPERHLILSPFHPEIQKTLKLMLPLLIGSSFGHINVVVDQMMASTLPVGSIGALHYADKLHSILTQVFIIVISRAILPYFAQQVAANDIEALKTTFFLTIKRISYILLPITIGIILFGEPLIQFIFQRREFSSHSTSATAGALSAYCLGLTMEAIGILTARMYNVLQDNKTLMYVAGGSIGLNIFFNRVFMKFWGHVGIALSTSGLYCVTTCILLYRLYKKIGKFWH